MSEQEAEMTKLSKHIEKALERLRAASKTELPRQMVKEKARLSSLQAQHAAASFAYSTIQMRMEEEREKLYLMWERHFSVPAGQNGTFQYHQCHTVPPNLPVVCGGNRYVAFATYLANSEDEDFNF